MTRSLLVLPALLLASACATVTQGTSQEVAILTPGVDNARCVVTDPEGEVVATVNSGGKARVSRGRRVLQVRCETATLAGTGEIGSSFSDRSRIQSPIGYAVDGLSGAMWSYPAEVTITLSPRT